MIEKNKSLTFETKSDNITVETNDGVTRVCIHNDLALVVEMDNDVMLQANGDFFIAAKGEIGLISKGKPICIDSIDSEIHLNSRKAKPIKHLPESIEYKKKMIEDNKRCIHIATMAEMRNKTLKDRVTDLENQIKIIQQKIGSEI